VSHILQDLVASMWSDASVRRSLERAERAYARRRQALLGALAAQGVEAWPAQSGLNVWLECPAESAAVQGLAARGWAVAPGERFRLQAPRGIRLTIARLAEDDADRLAADVAEVLVLSRRAPAV
jgi:DNA-binding transcriptional MocR family regulator